MADLQQLEELSFSFNHFSEFPTTLLVKKIDTFGYIVQPIGAITCFQKAIVCATAFEYPKQSN